MKYVDEHRNRTLCERELKEIESTVRENVTIMEVCGTHTVSIFRYGLRSLLPPEINLLSGPGCPVCVTSQLEIDRMIRLAAGERTIIATYGDMIKVPGSGSSLEKERARGRDIRIVYSALDAVALAEKNPHSRVVFLGVGFETTAPASAVAVLEAKRKNVENFSILCCHKLIPPAMSALLGSGDVKIDGFLCPGHVSTILGSGDYEFIPREFGIPCVIAGFEPLDILKGIRMLVSQVNAGRPGVAIQYRRSVRPDGNPKAMKILYDVFEPEDAVWRGIGTIPGSGLGLKADFEDFDAGRIVDLTGIESSEPPGCICGEILRGIRIPPECALFGESCTPENPVGPCMVSSEGTCGAYYRFGRRT